MIRLIALVAIFAVLHGISWLILNSSREQSYAVVKQYVSSDLHYSPSYDSGFANVQWAAVTQNIYKDGPEGILAQERRLIGAPNHSLNRYNLAMNYVRLDNWSRANELLSGHWREFPMVPGVISKLEQVFAHEGNHGELERLFESYVQKDSSVASLFFYIAREKEVRGEMDSALTYLDRGLRVSADTSIAHFAKLGELCLRTGRSDRALSILSVANTDRGEFREAIRAIRSGDTPRAIQTLSAISDSP